MARPIEFEIDNLKAAAYYVLAESNEIPTLTNIAKRAGINRTQLQNHFKFKKLRVLAVEHALDILTSDIFKIFKSEDGAFDVKIKMLVMHCMTKAKKHPNLVSFISKEYDLLEIETLKRFRQKARLDLKPFASELEMQVAQGNFITTDALHVLVYTMSLASYPVIAGDAIEIVTGTRSYQYQRVLSKHRDEIVAFILKGFKK